jgi:hypothetical protein
MCTIAVNGTTPYYQRHGEGPTVMCIAGATGAPSAGTGAGRPSPGGGGRRCARRWCRARRDATLSPTPGREVTRDRGHGTAHLAADPAAATARRRSPCSQRLRTIQSLMLAWTRRRESRGAAAPRHGRAAARCPTCGSTSSREIGTPPSGHPQPVRGARPRAMDGTNVKEGKARVS